MHDLWGKQQTTNCSSTINLMISLINNNNLCLQRDTGLLVFSHLNVYGFINKLWVANVCQTSIFVTNCNMDLPTIFYSLKKTHNSSKQTGLCNNKCMVKCKSCQDTYSICRNECNPYIYTTSLRRKRLKYH